MFFFSSPFPFFSSSDEFMTSLCRSDANLSTCMLIWHSFSHVRDKKNTHAHTHTHTLTHTHTDNHIVHTCSMSGNLKQTLASQRIQLTAPSQHTHTHTHTDTHTHTLTLARKSV